MTNQTNGLVRGCAALVAIVALVVLPAARAESKIDFNREIRPLLSAKCFACHGPDAKARKADLRLDTLEDATADRGGYKAVEPGKPEQSELITRINSPLSGEVMPPPKSGHRLTAQEKELLARWVREGAQALVTLNDPAFVEAAGGLGRRMLTEAGTEAHARVRHGFRLVLARRLVERGVRFVQIYDWGWDHHGSSPGESCDETLPIKCRQIDRAVTGLLTDLKQRGLLGETLVIWGGEFGRTPMMQNNVRTELKKGFIGRDHHPYAFTMWLAGGGIKPGLAYGATDDIGYYITEHKVTARDLQATILHLLGFDPHKFSFRYQGLNNRLIGPTDEARVVTDILA